jgi:hypothetical protein
MRIQTRLFSFILGLLWTITTLANPLASGDHKGHEDEDNEHHHRDDCLSDSEAARLQARYINLFVHPTDPANIPKWFSPNFKLFSESGNSVFGNRNDVSV